MSPHSPQYLCPICQQPLVYSSSVFRCSSNHCFDMAKEGYVNLLPVQFKHSKEPGDNKTMVNARRSFLELDFYQPLVLKLLAIYQQYGNTEGKVLDAGCGEGYYTHQHKLPTNNVYGVDIAKNAVKIAAKKHKACNFSVGTLSQLPFTTSYFDWIVSIYAPILEAEFSRVLKPTGFLLTVTPAENHLIELKKMIYQVANVHDTSRPKINNLTLINEQKLNYTMTFENGKDIINLLQMTPFAFKATKALTDELSKKEMFNCQADFHIRLYKKT